MLDEADMRIFSSYVLVKWDIRINISVKIRIGILYCLSNAVRTYNRLNDMIVQSHDSLSLSLSHIKILMSHGEGDKNRLRSQI